MKMKKANIIEKAFLISWPVTIVVSLIIFIVTSNSNLMVSYILGVASVLMMQSLNYRVMKDLYKNNPTKIKSRTIWLYIARFIFYGVILYVVYGSDKWNMYYTLAGLITFKIVLVVITLIFANKGDDSDEI